AHLRRLLRWARDRVDPPGADRAAAQAHRLQPDLHRAVPARDEFSRAAAAVADQAVDRSLGSGDSDRVSGPLLRTGPADARVPVHHGFLLLLVPPFAACVLGAVGTAQDPSFGILA